MDRIFGVTQNKEVTFRIDMFKKCGELLSMPATPPY